MAKSMYIKIFLLVIAISINCLSQDINTNILLRVFLVKYQNNAGSAFTIEYDNKQYLISAAHIFQGISQNSSIEIFHDSKWKILNVRRIGIVQDSVDIIVFSANFQLSPVYDMPASLTHIIIGQDIYFLGFPFGITTNMQTLNKYFPLPLVKKGILSGFFQKGKGTVTMMYFDAINNAGFSGGPIIFYDKIDKKLKIAGVVSAYVNQFDKVILQGQETQLQALTNSGFLIGYSIEHALEQIRKDPNGCLIK